MTQHDLFHSKQLHAWLSKYPCNVIYLSESMPWGWTAANMLVLKKVHEALGFQRCKQFSVGAAPIKMETMEYFMSLNIPIMPLYGVFQVI